MKANILALVIIAVIFGLAVSESLGQTQYVPAVNLITEKEGIGGEHAPLVFEGSGTFSKAGGAYTTPWMHIGYSHNSTNLQNRVASIFNPEVFTLNLKTSAYGAGDSSYVATAYFCTADDTTTRARIVLVHNDSTFAVGDEFTGTSSGATGTLETEVTADSIFFLTDVYGVFTTNDSIHTSGYGGGVKISAVTTRTNFFWNADSSNYFIKDGNFTHSQYGTWRFEDFNDSARVWSFPLRVLQGGFMRVIFASPQTLDTTTINWSLKCEN